MRYVPGQDKESHQGSRDQLTREQDPCCRNGVEGWRDRGVTLEHHSQRWGLAAAVEPSECSVTAKGGRRDLLQRRRSRKGLRGPPPPPPPPALGPLGGGSDSWPNQRVSDSASLWQKMVVFFPQFWFRWLNTLSLKPLPVYMLARSQAIRGINLNRNNWEQLKFLNSRLSLLVYK